MKTCKNCEHDFEGKFCNNCGQKSSVQKINYNYLLTEISESVFQVNRGLFFTIKELFIRPGHSIRQYLEGKRKPHFKPFAYVLIFSTLYVLASKLLEKNTFIGDAWSGLLKGWNNYESATTNNTLVLTWIGNEFTIVSLFLLPVFSFASYLAFKNYNYWEHLILNTFITGQQAAKIRKEAGEIDYQVLAYDNEPNKVIHYSRWESHEQAKAFFESDAVIAIRKELGVKQPTFIYAHQLEKGTL